MISDAMLIAAINEMQDHFDSHDVIIRLARDNQHGYVMALHDKVMNNVGTPFQALHGSLGTRIKSICDGLGYPSNDHLSNDIFGQKSHCREYRKTPGDR